MSLSYIRKVLSVAIAATAISGVAAPPRLAAASPDVSANITFTATGTFATPAVSGADQLKLAGQQFTINIVADSSLKPNKHGRNWTVFEGLKMTGTIYTGLLPPNTPVQIANHKAVIAEFVAASEDVFEAGFPVKVVGIDIVAIAHLVLPGGTLANDLIRPFSSVAIDPTTTTVTYKNKTAATVLAIQSATLVGALPTGGAEQ